MSGLAAVLGAATASLAAWSGAALPQAAEAMAPLPAEPPIGGVIWTVVIPAILFLGAFLATFLLYRRFAGGEE